MTNLNWQRILGVSSLIIALLLVCGSIYMHLKQKNHLGRLRHEDKVVPIIGGVDAAPEIAITLPVSIDDVRIQEEIDKLLDQSYQQTSDDYSSDELDYENSYDAVSTEQNPNLQELIVKMFVEEVQKDVQTHTNTNSFPQIHANSEAHAVGMSETCLRCICETVTECQPSLCADGKPCGYFRISVPYWIDAGSLLLEHNRNIENESTDFTELGYRQCVTNIFCAARTVFAFVDRYARDCNQDGIIDCRDHIALHMLGPSGCLRNVLLSPFYERMERCLSD